MVKIKNHCKADEHLSLALYWKTNIPLYDVMMQKNPVAVLSTISKLPRKLKNVIWNKFPLCSFYREHVNAVICSPVLLLRVTPILHPPSLPNQEHLSEVVRPTRGETGSLDKQKDKEGRETFRKTSSRRQETDSSAFNATQTCMLWHQDIDKWKDKPFSVVWADRPRKSTGYLKKRLTS